MGAHRIRIDCGNAQISGDHSLHDGIVVSGFDGVRIERCHMWQFGRHGLYATDCRDLHISDGSSTENLGSGVFMVSCSRSSIRGNRFWQNRGNSIELIDSHENRIRDNEVLESHGNGIDLQGSDGNRIRGNLSRDNQQDDLELGDSRNNEIKGNRFEGATFAGIHILSTFSNGNTFRKNTLSGNGSFDVHNGAEAGSNSFKGNSCQCARARRRLPVAHPSCRVQAR